MNILDALQKEAIVAELASRDKKGVIEELVTPLARIADISPIDLARVLMERERLGSTGIGNGIGIPHGKSDAIESMMLGFGRSVGGVDFESIDGRPTYIFFILLTPENAIDLHLKMLAQLSGILKNDLFIQRLIQAEQKNTIWEIIEQETAS